MKRVWSVIFAGGVLAALVASWAVVLRPNPEPVSADTWKALDALVQKEAGTNDLVIIHPVWEDSGIGYFRNQNLILGTPNNDRYRSFNHVWMLLTHDAPMPDYLTGLAQDFESEVNGVRVLRFSRGDTKHTRFDFFTNIKKARVNLLGDKGEVKPCSEFRNNTWLCPVRDWNNLAQRSVTIDGQSQVCLWLHPVKGYTTQAIFPRVKMGKRLVGQYALSDEAAKTKGMSPVDFIVRLNGEPKRGFLAGSGTGWRRFEIDTRELENGMVDVGFETRAELDGMRHFCFLAQIRDDEPGKDW